MASRPELESVDHDYLGDAHDRNARRTWWVVALTSVMMVGEIVVGHISGSMALTADGFHMATHAGALGIAAIAYSYARRHVNNPRYSFGTGKVGDLAGFASALVLGIVSLGIAVESLTRLVNPVPVDFGQATIVAIIGLVVNLVSAVMLGHGHTHDHDDDDHGHDHAHHHDHNLRAAYIHVIADALTSVLAIVALVAGRYAGWVWLDPLVGILGAIVIARWAWGLMRDTSAILLDAADPVLDAKVRAAVEASGGRIADLHVWRVGPNAHAAIVSLGACDGDPAAIRAALADLPQLAHITIECR